jgi:hypothetical protein
VGMWWLSGDVVALSGMWWLSRGCGSSVGMWWLSRGCGGSVGMWWLSGDVVALGDMVAQKGMWWLSGLSQLGNTSLKTQQSRVRIRLTPERDRKHDCVLKNKSQGGRRPCLSKKKFK